jgi:hypothetical protein
VNRRTLGSGLLRREHATTLLSACRGCATASTWLGLAWLASTGGERATPAAGRRNPAHRPTSGRLRVNILYTETTTPCTTQLLQEPRRRPNSPLAAETADAVQQKTRPSPRSPPCRAVQCPSSTLFAAIGSGKAETGVGLKRGAMEWRFFHFQFQMCFSNSSQDGWHGGTVV